MEILIIILFAAGYIAIALEHSTRINKAAVALITAVVCWSVLILGSEHTEQIGESLEHHLGELSGILFFLLGAMTIVEIVDAHDGFEIITTRIVQRDKRQLLWLLSFLAFFLSAALDNLTTTIVMISLTRKLVSSEKERLFFAGMIVIAANAGGAWSPIGDVTTTMLWIGGQITSLNVIKTLFIPSIVCLILPLLVLSSRIKGSVDRPLTDELSRKKGFTPKQQTTIFVAGVLVLVFVPVFKTITHLPPYMGILGGLGVLWILTEILHGKKAEEEKHALSVATALRRIDAPSILFFLGILLSIGALDAAGILNELSAWLSATMPNDNIKLISFGLLSAIVDNVPLVAAAQNMWSLELYPVDHYFWELLAYSTGTGGSALIIGSAAGVAAMGMERISFMWYLKKFSLIALLGFFGGAITYILQHSVFG